MNHLIIMISNHLAEAEATMWNSDCIGRNTESSSVFEEEIILELKNRAGQVILEKYDRDSDSRNCRTFFRFRDYYGSPIKKTV